MENCEEETFIPTLFYSGLYVYTLYLENWRGQKLTTLDWYTNTADLIYVSQGKNIE